MLSSILLSVFYSKSMSLDIWILDALSQLLIGGSYTEIKFPKNSSG